MQHDHDAQRNARDPRADIIFADAVDVPAEFREPEHREHDEREDQQRDDRHRDAGDASGPELLEPSRVAGEIDNVRRNEEGAAEAVDRGAERERREDRGNLDIGDEDAVDQAEGDRERETDREGREEAVAGIGEIEREAHRDDEVRNDREVDAPAEDDERHADAQHGEDGDAADQRQHVADGQEARKEDGEGGEDAEKNREDDPLLIQLRLQRQGFSSLRPTACREQPLTGRRHFRQAPPYTQVS